MTLSLAVIDMKLSVRDDHEVKIEDHEDVEPVCAAADKRCQIHIPHKIKEDTIIDMFSITQKTGGKKLRKSFSQVDFRLRRTTNAESQKKHLE